MATEKEAKLDVSKFILKCVPSVNRERDWQMSAAQAAGIHPPTRSIPRSRDLRDDSWWPVGNQGATGSCVGWGTADGVLRWHFAMKRKITHQQSLSVRYIWMASKESDEFTSRPTTFIEQDGTSLKAALEVARNYGMVTSDVLPFESPPGAPELYTGGDAKTFYALAARMRIASYFNLGADPVDWRSWLALNGPILSRLDVDTAWDNAGSNGGNLDTYDAAHTRGGHCIAIVGYTAERFIVRNSWGDEWGDKGYAYASNDYAARAFTEAYGVAL